MASSKSPLVESHRNPSYFLSCCIYVWRNQKLLLATTSCSQKTMLTLFCSCYQPFCSFRSGIMQVIEQFLRCLHNASESSAALPNNMLHNTVIYTDVSCPCSETAPYCTFFFVPHIFIFCKHFLLFL